MKSKFGFLSLLTFFFLLNVIGIFFTNGEEETNEKPMVFNLENFQLSNPKAESDRLQMKNGKQVRNDPDWDWMDCQHGTFFDGYHHFGLPEVCQCDSGWGGVDCQLCLSDQVCEVGETCDTSLYIAKGKSYNCHPTAQSVFSSGSITAYWTIPHEMDTGDGYGHMNVYLNNWGSPWLFSCNFTGCKGENDDNSIAAACTDTRCHCTSYCNPQLTMITSQMKGWARFECDIQTQLCEIKQEHLPLELGLECTASGCTRETSGPSSNMELWKYVLIFCGVIGGIIFCVGLIALGCFAHGQYFAKYEINFLKEFLARPHKEAFLSWKDVYNFIEGVGGVRQKTILNGITGVAEPGEILALMGPSGAGKTSLLDFLAGRKNTGVMKGTVMVNGFPRGSNFKRLAGYVYQDDKLMGTLTVREHLSFVAQLRLDSLLPYSYKMQRVDEVLADLNISHIAESFIGTETTRGISGGERKRVAIAAELITDPHILFLDEPTSGLDSYTAYTLLRTLHELAKEKKRTIIMSIHQPSSQIYELFDKVMLLAHGELLYLGPANAATEYFATITKPCPSNYNPADYLIDLVQQNTKQKTSEFANNFRQSLFSTQIRNTINSINSSESEEFGDVKEHATSFITQLWLIAKRTAVNNFRNPYLLRTQYAVTIGLAVIIGTIFWKITDDISGIQNRFGSIFFMLALLSFGCMASIDTFFHERPLFLRERANGMYRTSSYFLAKTICDFVPMRMLPPLMMGSITYFMIGLNNKLSRFLWFELTLTLVTMTAGSVCLAISSVVPSIGMGNLLGILIMMFSMLFGGFFLSKTNMPPFIDWIKYLSFFNYGYEVLMVNELTDEDFTFNPKNYKPILVSGDEFLQQFDMDPSRFYLDIGVLVGMIILLLFLSYALLRFAIKERR